MIIDTFKVWYKNKRWKSSRPLQVLLFFVLGVMLFLTLVGNLPEPLQIKKFEISPMDIRSPITIEDTEKTRQAREEAVNAVQPVYQRKDSITEKQIVAINNLFDKSITIREAQELNQKEKVEQIKNLFSSYPLSNQSYQSLVTLSDENLKIVRTTSINLVEQIMREGVPSYGGIQQFQRKISDSLSLSDYDPRVKQLVEELTQVSIVPNIVYDEQATEELKELERQRVKPVMIFKNDILVEKGQFVDNEVYRKLTLVGLLSERSSYTSIYALGLLVILTIGFLYLIITQTHPALLKDNGRLIMFLLMILLTIASMKIISLVQSSEHPTMAYLAPAALGTMLITLLIDIHLVVASAGIFALAASIMFNLDSHVFPFDFRYGFMVLISSLTGAYTLGQTKQRRYIIRAGALVGVANIVAISIIYLLSFVSIPWKEASTSYMYGMLGGLLSAVLTIGFLPFFEGAFGILSTVKLIELSNPNHPLLRRLLTEAPGTYHHSVIVGNLAEAACETIGANGLLARVGSYYHDVGKLNRPNFFIENQMNGENPHDRISPELSKNIIISHPYDGVKMLKQHKIPQPICDIAEQHHGTSLLKYFYHKAHKESKEPIDEKEFRYPGPKPRDKEVAVVQICDSVEAATRSMSHLTPDKIKTIVRAIVKDKLDDGQFDECNITLKELEMVTNSVCETLMGTFHTRIEYPNEEDLHEVNKA